MMNACARVAIVLLALCVGAGRVAAVFIPTVQRPTKAELKEQKTIGY